MSSGGTSGFFTLGVRPDLYHLPHPRLGLPVILLIRRVLLRAFELLRDRKYDLSAASEDEVTAALRSTIENSLRQTGEVKGFNKRTFEFVVRQGQWQNFNGTVLTKTPDLFFKLRDDDNERARMLSEFDGLFIEAKPMDAKHPAGSKYCDDGLIRFVRGDYAWAMQEAMMLAYTRDGRTISGHLIPAMDEVDRMTSPCITSGIVVRNRSGNDPDPIGEEKRDVSEMQPIIGMSNILRQFGRQVAEFIQKRRCEFYWRPAGSILDKPKIEQ